MSTPIRIVDYFVEQLEYNVYRERLKHGASAPLHNEVAIQAGWSIRPAPGQEGRESQASTEVMEMRLGVRVNADEDAPEEAAYRAVVGMAGIFERDVPGEEMDPELYLKHTVASGISALYSAARDVLAQLTSASPLPKLMLPSIAPFPLASQMVDDHKAGVPEGEDAGE